MHFHFCTKLFLPIRLIFKKLVWDFFFFFLLLLVFILRYFSKNTDVCFTVWKLYRIARCGEVTRRMTVWLLSSLLIRLLANLCFQCYLLSHLLLSRKFHQPPSPQKYPETRVRCAHTRPGGSAVGAIGPLGPPVGCQPTQHRPPPEEQSQGSPLRHPSSH